LPRRRRRSLRAVVMCTWCSSAKRENFNHFTLSCFNYVTRI
jgi:hypothetical protein